MPTLPPPERLDVSPLTSPMSRRELRAAVKRAEFRTGTLPDAGGVIVAVFAVVVGGFMAFIAWREVALIDPGPGSLLLPVGMVAIGGGIWAVSLSAAHRERLRLVRLDGFARANGLTFAPKHAELGQPGLLFADGLAGSSTDAVIGTDIVVANYRSAAGSGMPRSSGEWGYLSLRLAVRLPNIVLDATGNNGLFGETTLPARFARSQRLSLEGDFDRHFSLYCPTGYEADALYLFTPDVMARFIDDAAQLDVEIVDDRLYLYSRRELSTLDPATWLWLASIVDALESKLAQWARWRDDRLAATSSALVPPAGGATASLPSVASPALLRPPPAVAPQGRRLRRAVPWVGVGALIAMTVAGVVFLIVQ